MEIKVGCSYQGKSKTNIPIIRTIISEETKSYGQKFYTYTTNRKGFENQTFICALSTLEKWIKVQVDNYTNFQLIKKADINELADFLVSLECKNCHMVANDACQSRCFNEKLNWLGDVSTTPSLTNKDN